MTSKEEIKAWLKDSGMSRQELAARCGVTLSSVNNWLSNSKTNQIPELKMQLIEKLMQETKRKEERPEQDSWRAVGVLLSNEDVELIQKVTGNKPLDIAVRELLLEKMHEILNKG